MTHKHISFSDSIVMKELEKVAYKKKLVEDEVYIPILNKKASFIKLQSSGDVFFDAIALASALREKGFVKQAKALEERAVEFKKIAGEDQGDKYNWWEEEGDSLLNHAHPEDKVELPSSGGHGLVEDEVEQHRRMLNSVNRQPTGKMANLDSKMLVIQAINALAQGAAPAPAAPASPVEGDDAALKADLNSAKKKLAASILSLSEFFDQNFDLDAVTLNESNYIVTSNGQVLAIAAEDYPAINDRIANYNKWLQDIVMIQGQLTLIIGIDPANIENVPLTLNTTALLNFANKFNIPKAKELVTNYTNYKSLLSSSTNVPVTNNDIPRRSARGANFAQTDIKKEADDKEKAKEVLSIMNKQALEIWRLLPTALEKEYKAINAITTAAKQKVLESIATLKGKINSVYNEINKTDIAPEDSIDINIAQSLSGMTASLIKVANGALLIADIKKQLDESNIISGIESNKTNFDNKIKSAEVVLGTGTKLKIDSAQLKIDIEGLKNIRKEKASSVSAEKLRFISKDIAFYSKIYNIINSNKDKSFSYMQAQNEFLKEHTIESLENLVKQFHENVVRAERDWRLNKPAMILNENLKKVAADSPSPYGPDLPKGRTPPTPGGGVGGGGSGGGGGGVKQTHSELLTRNIVLMQREQGDFAVYMSKKNPSAVGALATGLTLHSVKDDGVWGPNTESSLRQIQEIIDKDPTLKNSVQGKIEPAKPAPGESDEQINNRVGINVMVIRRALAIAGNSNYKDYLNEAISSKGYDMIPTTYTDPTTGTPEASMPIDNGIQITGGVLRSLLGLKNYLLDNNYSPMSGETK
jgi:hypothetical protein